MCCRFVKVGTLENMMNYFGWIDFSRKDRELARDIIAALNDKGAVDEMGIGVIRDAFSDYFFPGTSTIQTSAKYFFLVSYQLENLTRFPVPNPERVLRENERECSFVMWKSLSPEKRKKEGIFGRTFFERGAKDWVKRTPSVIYWRGIRELGFWRCDNELSLQEFLRVSSSREAIPVESDEDLKNGKKRAPDYEKSWHWNLPPPEARGNWQNSPDIKLTPGEARFFLEQITHEQPDSMFAFLAPFRRELPARFADIGELELPAHLREAWLLAEKFSEFMWPAQLRFNALLGNEEAIAHWDDYETEWLAEAAEEVDLNAIFSFLKLEAHRQLRHFLEKLEMVYKSGNIEALDKLLSERECQLKGKSRMKLGKENPYYQEHWVGSQELQYRYGNARRLFRDVVKAEEMQ